MKKKNRKRQKNEKLEKYASGAAIAFLWQIIFVKLILGQEWYLTSIIAAMTAILFFIIAVLMFETSKLKGDL